MINVGIIGTGYWGPNYIRILTELDTKAKLISCCDLQEKNLKKIKSQFPAIKTTKDYKEIIKDPEIDAVIITTSPVSHYKIAKDSFTSGKHVLVEKPLTTNVNDAKKLVELSDKKDKILMVGHVFNYNPGVKKLKEMISKGEFGTIFYLWAERMGLGPIRKQGNALWDLATHDISMSTFLLNTLPISVSALGKSYIQKNVEDAILITLEFPDRILYNIFASWFNPEKIRKTTVIGSNKMAVFNDVNKSEMIKIYDRRIDESLLNTTPEYIDHQNVVRFGDIQIPRLDQSEPLKIQVEHFLDCISKNVTPLTDGRNGLNVVRILEAAEKSLKSGGTRVKV